MTWMLRRWSCKCGMYAWDRGEARGPLDTDLIALMDEAEELGHTPSACPTVVKSDLKGGPAMES